MSELSGEVEITPGLTFSATPPPGDLVTYAKLNQLGAPTARVGEGAIGERELDGAAVRNLAPPLNRNLLINGNFDIWQRGGYPFASFNDGLPDEMGRGSGVTQFTADRWLSTNVTSAVDRRAISQQPFTPGQIQVPNEPAYFLRYQQLISDAGSALSQSIEDVRTMAGKRVVLTWWMKSSNYSGGITVQLEQHYGGSPEPTPIEIAAVSGGTALLVAGAAWVQYTAIFDVPVLDGGTTIDEDNALVLRFLLPTGTWIIDFSQAQLEEGGGATDFERRSFFDEQLRCERYFEFHTGVFSDDLTHTKPCFYFATRKYKTPTLAFVTATGTGHAVTALSNVGYYQSTANSTLVVFTLTADAEIYR